MVTISVVMPVYNTKEEYLRKAIESILNQTFSDFEFIIIDDGSTTNVKEIISSYADNRIKYIYQENTGIVGALNKGLDNAIGKYIARMDSDDISLPDRFEKQIYIMENNKGIGLCGTCVEEFIDETGEIVNLFAPFKEYPTMIDILFSPIICHPTAMFRTSVMKKNNIKYNNEYLYAEDQDMWRKMLQHSNAYVIQENLLRYRRHNQAISNINAQTGLDNYDKVKLEIIRDLYPILKPTKENLDVLLKDIWDENLGAKKICKTNKCLMLAQKIFSIKNDYKHKVITIFGIKFKFKSKKLLKRIGSNENSFTEDIFSAKNRDIHKVITILGVKFKFKSKKLIEQKRWQELQNSINQLHEQTERYNKVVASLDNKLNLLQTNMQSQLLTAFDSRQMKFNILKEEYNLVIREGTSDLSVFYQVFVDDNYKYSYAKDPQIILDIGANVGYTSIYYAKLFPKSKIYCLESDPENYKILLKNIEKYPNITPCNGALYSRDTILSIYDPNLGEWGLQVSETENNTNKKVQAYSFNSLLKLWELENTIIDVLKIDIEGSEKELFEGDVGFLNSVDLMIIETHDRFKSGTSQALFKVMQNKEFILNVKGEDLVFESKTYRSK